MKFSRKISDKRFEKACFLCSSENQLHSATNMTADKSVFIHIYERAYSNHCKIVHS